MLQFNPNDPGDTPYKLQRAVKESGLSLQQICDRMKSEYGESLTPSALSHSINRGTLSLQRALQILAISREISPLRVIHAGFYAVLLPIHANSCSQDDRCRDASFREHAAL
jgi:hypothetical protein